jgi:hypothetical protein
VAVASEALGAALGERVIRKINNPETMAMVTKMLPRATPSHLGKVQLCWGL